MMNGLNRLSHKVYRIISISLIILVLLVPINCTPGGNGGGKPPALADTTTAGASWSTWVMEQIAEGIAHYTTDQSIGWILSAFGSGSNSSNISNALQDMNSKLTQIEADLQQIKGELDIIAQALSIDTAKILNEEQQTEMSQAELAINNQFTNVKLFAQYGVPGSDAAKTAAQQFADDFLTTGNNDMDANVYTIYGIIMNVNQDLNGGALNALTSMLVAEANDGKLLARYQTLESYFNSLLEVQMKGAVLMMEALHHRDDPFVGGTTAQRKGVGIWPGTAEEWYNKKFLPQIADEVEEFLRCTDRLVLADADLRTDIGLPVIPNSISSLPPVNQEPFLPADADAIFSRADFLAAQMSPTRHSFGLVVRAVGEPDSINSYVAQKNPPRAQYNDNHMNLTPLGPGTDPSKWVKVRLVPVEVWSNWPSGWTQAYMQWNWRQGGDGNWDYLSFNSATQIAVTKYEIGWYGAGATTGIDWLTASPEPANAKVTTALYNDKMEPDPKGTHAWGHATLAVRHRPTAWRRYTFNPDSYDSRYFTVTNDYNMNGAGAEGPNVRLISTFTGYSHANASFSLESSLTLHIVNGMNHQQKATAVVQMQGDTNGSLYASGGDKLTYWFTDASGETDYWTLKNSNGHVYPISGIFHYWNPGEDTSFHFKLNFNNTVSTNYHNAGEYVGARIWTKHVYLFF